MLWNPDWKDLAVDQDLKSLTDNSASLFNLLDEDDLRDLLRDCGAQVSARVPASIDLRPGAEELKLHAEGVQLAEELDSYHYLFCTLEGALVMYQRREIVSPVQTGFEPDARSRAKLVRDDQKPSAEANGLPLVTLNYLYYNCVGRGVRWPGQVAGLAQTTIRSHPTYNTEPFSTRWLNSLMASTSSVVLRVPVEEFKKLLLDKTRTVKVRREAKPVVCQVRPLSSVIGTRIYESTAVRYSTLQRNAWLHERRQFDRLLAYVLYEYYLGRGITRVRGTSYKVAFYLNTTEANVADHAKKLMNFSEDGKRALSKIARTLPEYTLEPELCRRYYLAGFE